MPPPLAHLNMLDADDEPTDAERVLRIRAGIAIVDHQLSQWLARLNRDELRDIPATRRVCQTYEQLAALQGAVNELERHL